MTAKRTDFEKQLTRLQTVVDQLESGELPLEKGVALYKEGLTLARGCREQLAKARHDIRIFSEGSFKEFDSEGVGQDEGGSAAGTDGE